MLQADQLRKVSQKFRAFAPRLTIIRPQVQPGIESLHVSENVFELVSFSSKLSDLFKQEVLSCHVHSHNSLSF
jgi:hypothetical protein